jgi:hypothetical protein
VPLVPVPFPLPVDPVPLLPVPAGGGPPVAEETGMVVGVVGSVGAVVVVVVSAGVEVFPPGAAEAETPVPAPISVADGVAPACGTAVAPAAIALNVLGDATCETSVAPVGWLLPVS